MLLASDEASYISGATIAGHRRQADHLSRAARCGTCCKGRCCWRLAACGDKPSPSNVEAPGADKRAGTAVLETGAALLQDKPPIEALNAYLDGFHFYSGEWTGRWKRITTARCSTTTSSSA